jgi:putative membrane protein
MSGEHPMKWAWVGLGSFILILGSILFFASIMRFGFFSRSYYGMPMMGGGGWVFGLLGFIFICFLVFMVIRFVSWGSMGHRRSYRWSNVDAEEILRQRYAKGEITKEQFDQMLRDLREASR